MERYFVTIDTPRFTVERPAGMFRLVSDPKGMEVEFYNREGQWEQDPSLLGRVFEGDAGTVEVTVEQAERVLGRWAEQDSAAAGKAGVTKAVNPRDADESRLRQALALLFGKLSPQAARRIERGEMPSDKEIADALRRTIEPILIEAAVGEYSRLAAQVGVQFDVAAVQAELAGWARRYSFELVTGLTETTREVLQQAIAQYAETPGMTRAALEQLIAPAFSQERASLIASTEITRGASEAFNQYQREMSDAGVTMERIWDALNDSLTCPLICAPLDGKPESEWRDRYPDGPPAHPGCRCSLTLRSVASGPQA